jgi:hypothetical protein
LCFDAADLGCCSEQGCDELASAGRPAKLQSDWTAIGFNGDPEAEKAATVAFGLDCTEDCGKCFG